MAYNPMLPYLAEVGQVHWPKLIGDPSSVILVLEYFLVDLHLNCVLRVEANVEVVLFAGGNFDHDSEGRDSIPRDGRRKNLALRFLNIFLNGFTEWINPLELRNDFDLTKRDRRKKKAEPDDQDLPDESMCGLPVMKHDL